MVVTTTGSDAHDCDIHGVGRARLATHTTRRRVGSGEKYGNLILAGEGGHQLARAAAAVQELAYMAPGATQRLQGGDALE